MRRPPEVSVAVRIKPAPMDGEDPEEEEAVELLQAAMRGKMARSEHAAAAAAKPAATTKKMSLRKIGKQMSFVGKAKVLAAKAAAARATEARLQAEA
eukprot:1483445-Prymnesium_polylepis.1